MEGHSKRNRIIHANRERWWTSWRPNSNNMSSELHTSHTVRPGHVRRTCPSDPYGRLRSPWWRSRYSNTAPRCWGGNLSIIRPTKRSRSRRRWTNLPDFREDVTQVCIPRRVVGDRGRGTLQRSIRMHRSCRRRCIRLFRALLLRQTVQMLVLDLLSFWAILLEEIQTQ